MGALRDALIDAGAQPDKADRAAEELSGYNTEFGDIRRDIATARADAKQEFAAVRVEITDIRGDIRLLRWMAGANTALILAVFVRLFIH